MAAAAGILLFLGSGTSARLASGGRRGINWTNIVGDATSKSAYFKGFRGSSIRALASQGNNNYMNYLGRPPARRRDEERETQGGVDSFVNGSEFKCKSLSDRNPQTLNGGEQKRGGALHDALRCFDRQ